MRLEGDAAATGEGQWTRPLREAETKDTIVDKLHSGPAAVNARQQAGQVVSVQ